MESHNDYRRGEDELESNYSYGSGDDDPILTATITFDVTVDPNGQVISASEGQVIAEGVQRSMDDRGLGQLHHDPLPMVEPASHKDNDDDDADSDDSASTSTDSLMERTKKYMSEEAGIIILKRTNQNPKNFNINLDFDVENSLSENALNAQGNNFNLNFDFENSSQLRETKEPPQAWVDIDLMITSSATNSKIEERQSNETFEEIKNALKNRASNDAQYWRTLDKSDSNEPQKNQSLIENDLTGESLNRSELKDEYPGYHHYVDNINSHRFLKRQMERNSNIENERARMELIDRLVEKASSKQSPSEKNSYYTTQLPKVENFSLEDCIERVLDSQTESRPGPNEVPVLRTFETLDIDALTKGFEPEELNEGKLVLYITEKQLLQLLKQRAIVVPNKSSLDDFSNKKFSLVDEKIGSRLNGRKGPSQVELIVNQNQPQLSKITESQEDTFKKSAQDNLSSDAYNQPIYESKPGRENLPRDAYNQPTYESKPGRENLPRDALNEQNYDTKSGKKSGLDQFYKDQYFPSKTSNKSGSILYEETFEHIRTVSEASGKENLPSIKPGSTSFSDDYYAKIGSKEYPRTNNQYTNFIPDQIYLDSVTASKNRDYQVNKTLLNKDTFMNQSKTNSYRDSIPNKVINQAYPNMVSEIYSSDEQQNKDLTGLPKQYGDNQFYSQGYDGYTQTLDSRKLTNRASSNGGLQGSVYIGDNYPSQSNIINDVLKTASKITNDIDYSTIMPTNGLDNIQTSSLTNMHPNLSYSLQARDLENQAITELDRLVKNLSSSVKEDKIDWNKVQNDYKSEEGQNKAGVLQNYVSSLIEHEKAKTNQLEQLDSALGQKIGQDLDKLKVLDGFIDRAVSRGEVVHGRNESATHSISVLNDLVNQLKDNIKSRNLKLDEFKTGHKIVIKTTRRLPPRVISQSATNVANCNNRSSLGKKRLSSSYLNNSRTRVYELGAKGLKDKSQNSNLFNSKQNVDYSVHSYEPIVDSSFGKASTEKINKYLSVVNTGINNNDLIQIHPLLNNKTDINTKTNSGRISPSLSVREPVMIGSNNYLEEVSKHFGGLKVTDFPMYVQGLEFKKSKKSGLKKSGSIVKQTVNNGNNNIQFVKVNSAASATNSNPIKAQ